MKNNKQYCRSEYRGLQAKGYNSKMIIGKIFNEKNFGYFKAF